MEATLKLNRDSTDQELLCAYVESQDEQAFARLIDRHLRLVFGTAFRLLSDRSTAEEVSQNVFITLARKAKQTSASGGLAGWLHRATIFEARLRQRTDLRRRNREETAGYFGTTLSLEGSTPPVINECLNEFLDEALLALPEMDRRVLLLRFFEGQTLRNIGLALGIGDDAAQKRTERALEAVARLLRRRTAATVTALIAARALTAASIPAVPTVLASTILSAALSSVAVTTVTSATAVSGILAVKLMTFTKTSSAICLLLAVGTLSYQWHSIRVARDSLVHARRQLATTVEDLNAAQAANGKARRLRFATESGLATARAELRRATLPGEVIGITSEDPLYFWSESSPFVRVPKSLLSQLRLSGFISVPVSGPRAHRIQLDPVSQDGTLSEELTEALGITSTEAVKLKEIFTELAQSAADQIQSRAYLTNQMPAEFNAATVPSWTLVTPALPDGGESLREGFRSRISATLGTERTRSFFQQSEEMLFRHSNAFGALERVQSVAMTEVGWSTWEMTRAPDGEISNFTTHSGAGSVSLDSVPSQLRQSVAEWRARASTETPRP